MDIVRRRMFTQKGEALILCESAHSYSERFTSLADMSGLADTDVLAHSVCSIAIPDYRTIPDGRKRWEGTRAAFMWHPLMWLPERLRDRKKVETEDGRVLVEPNAVWMLRVCLELIASGLYDADSGTWVDVMSAVGLDITDPNTVNELQAWLDGGEHEVFDTIDLDDVMSNPDDPDWSFDIAVTIATEVQRASWAVIANDLLAMADYIADGRLDTHADALTTMRTIIYTASDVLADVPSSGEGENQAFWDSALQIVEAADDLDGILYGNAFVPVEQYLTQVRDRYWDNWEALPAFLGEEEEQEPTPPEDE